MRALLVVNPKATATTAPTRSVLAHALASETKLDVAETSHRGHAVELAHQAALDGIELVVALGGDGTVNEVVNGLLADGPGSHVPAFAVVPGGSTNVLARAVGMPADPVEAVGTLLDALRADRRRSLGLGNADGRWFTFNAGLGFDADVVRRVERRRAAGRRASGPLFVSEAVRHFYLSAERRHAPLTAHLPGGDEQLFLALVCNTSPWTYLGDRPVRPCPQASFDTCLDLFGLSRFGTVPMLRHLRQILSAGARVGGRRVVLEHDLTDFTVTAPVPVAFQVDGDDLGDRTSVTFRSVPAAIDVVA
ncbi:MAG: diacylglycerol kinase family lipid kinase [Actinomycetota bacterium]|nr:diacylglycerol kinase family lipid kinase [Actinomycetota bacterium]